MKLTTHTTNVNASDPEAVFLSIIQSQFSPAAARFISEPRWYTWAINVPTNQVPIPLREQIIQQPRNFHEEPQKSKILTELTQALMDLYPEMEKVAAALEFSGNPRSRKYGPSPWTLHFTYQLKESGPNLPPDDSPSERNQP
jgi:hypothetical protein